jgi:hypothetical protein
LVNPVVPLQATTSVPLKDSASKLREVLFIIGLVIRCVVATHVPPSGETKVPSNGGSSPLATQISE